MSSDIPPLATYLRVFGVLGGTFSIGARIVISTLNGQFPLISFRAYTLQSNFLIWLWCLLALLWAGTPRYDRLTGNLKTALTAYITITFLVFWILLEPIYDPTGIDWWTSLFNHYLLCWAYILDWVIAERTRLTYKWLIPSLIYPYLYLAFALIYGQITGIYIYFFVDLPTLGVAGLITWVAILTVLFLLVGCLYTYVNRNVLTERAEQ